MTNSHSDQNKQEVYVKTTSMGVQVYKRKIHQLRQAKKTRSSTVDIKIPQRNEAHISD